MNCAIVHRGPDEDGFYLKDNIGLAMRRLSIIDLSGGQQPIHNADKTKWIVYNGEVYNYQELRRGLEERGHQLYTNSDTEAVLHLYEEEGPDCLRHLRGMFAFAIWDEVDKSLFIARDRVGKKPVLYSHQTNGDLIFGSEFQALLKHPAVSRDVDDDALNDYLSYLCVPAPKTAFKSIRKLEPGHWLRWKDGAIETRRYWQPDFSKKIKISEQDAIEETTRIIRESTRLRMIAGSSSRGVPLRRRRFIDCGCVDGARKLDAGKKLFRSDLKNRITASSNTLVVSRNTSVRNTTSSSSSRMRWRSFRRSSSTTESRTPTRPLCRRITSREKLVSM
jgi:asparagine synthase (glutamine-hydrolysing)